MAAAITRSRLAAELRALGMRAGAVTMVHTRMSALGWVVGGSETVVRALLDSAGEGGTVMAYAGWEEHVYRIEDRPAEYRTAYLEEPPVIDLATGEATREHGRVPERLRTWPGAARSANPDASMVAVGARAAWLTASHPPDDGYGANSPLGRLVEAGGDVLMLGAPLDTITLLHHAEALARSPGKRRVEYRLPVLEGDRVAERAFADIDTSEDVLPYGLEEDAFAVIAREALAAGTGVPGRVGLAECHLFGAAELTDFAVAWIEERFGVA